MLYLLDANVLIDAKRDYYQMNRVPEFWAWLIYMGESSNVKIPIEIYEEITTGSGTDPLVPWLKDTRTKQALILDEDVDVDLVAKIIDEGYASDLTDDEVVTLGRDPFLIAYAMQDPHGRCIVTTECSKPRRIRANRHLPDVCDQFSIQHCNTYQLINDLDFNTKWHQ